MGKHCVCTAESSVRIRVPPPISFRGLPRTAVCKTVPRGTEVKARGALPSAPTRLQIIIKFVIINDGKLAQLVERRPYKANVGGSNPSLPTSLVGQ